MELFIPICQLSNKGVNGYPILTRLLASSSMAGAHARVIIEQKHLSDKVKEVIRMIHRPDDKSILVSLGCFSFY